MHRGWDRINVELPFVSRVRALQKKKKRLQDRGRDGALAVWLVSNFSRLAKLYLVLWHSSWSLTVLAKLSTCLCLFTEFPLVTFYSWVLAVCSYWFMLWRWAHCCSESYATRAHLLCVTNCLSINVYFKTEFYDAAEFCL